MRHTRFLWIGALVALLPAPSHVAARTWTVGQSGTEDFEELYDACEAAASGDSILISPGSYDEPGTVIQLHQKPLSIIGTGREPDDTILRTRIRQTYCRGSLIENLAMRDSWAPLVALEGRIVIRNCAFRNNTNYSVYGPVDLRASNAIVEDCIFADNGHSPQQLRNGALSVGDTTVVRRCLFINNAAVEQAGAMTAGEAIGPSIVEDCVFIGNSAATGAAIVMFVNAIVRGCTFWANRPTGYLGGTIFVDDLVRTISHSIIAGTIGGWGIACWGAMTLRCCDLWDNDEGDYWGLVDAGQWLGNFSADPLFCDPEEGDLHLMEGSPCLPGQHYGVECGLVGALGLGCGLSGTEFITWGRLKADFR